MIKFDSSDFKTNIYKKNWPQPISDQNEPTQLHYKGLWAELSSPISRLKLPHTTSIQLFHVPNGLTWHQNIGLRATEKSHDRNQNNFPWHSIESLRAEPSPPYPWSKWNHVISKQRFTSSTDLDPFVIELHNFENLKTMGSKTGLAPFMIKMGSHNSEKKDLPISPLREQKICQFWTIPRTSLQFKTISRFLQMLKFKDSYHLFNHFSVIFKMWWFPFFLLISLHQRRDDSWLPCRYPIIYYPTRESLMFGF